MIPNPSNNLKGPSHAHPNRSPHQGRFVQGPLPRPERGRPRQREDHRQRQHLRRLVRQREGEGEVRERKLVHELLPRQDDGPLHGGAPDPVRQLDQGEDEGLRRGRRLQGQPRRPRRQEGRGRVLRHPLREPRQARRHHRRLLEERDEGVRDAALGDRARRERRRAPRVLPRGQGDAAEPRQVPRPPGPDRRARRHPQRAHDRPVRNGGRQHPAGAPQDPHAPGRELRGPAGGREEAPRPPHDRQRDRRIPPGRPFDEEQGRRAGGVPRQVRRRLPRGQERQRPGMVPAPARRRQRGPLRGEARPGLQRRGRVQRPRRRGEGAVPRGGAQGMRGRDPRRVRGKGHRQRRGDRAPHLLQGRDDPLLEGGGNRAAHPPEARDRGPVRALRQPRRRQAPRDRDLQERRQVDRDDRQGQVRQRPQEARLRLRHRPSTCTWRTPSP